MVGNDPTAYRLSSDCSTTELHGYMVGPRGFEPLTYGFEDRYDFHFTKDPYVEQDIGLEPMTISLATKYSSTELILQGLAESIGVEPIHLLLSDGLANRCLNRSANPPDTI